jgi:hypothetical protein
LVTALIASVVGSATDQDEASVAISAIGITFFIDLQPDPGMTQRRRNIAAAVAGDAGFADSDGFRFVGHAWALSKAVPGLQRLQK